MKDFKFTTIFSSAVRPMVSEDKDFYLAMASLADVSRFLPDVDSDKNIDLLPIAFNAFVANRVNKNGDVVNTETAVAMHKDFINKPINIEHNRQRVVGTILTAGFSEFGTDRPLTEDEVKVMDSPFNVTLGGVVWKVVNNDLAEKIQESADPTSDSYQDISASWELGFNEYGLALLPVGDKNLENAETITDPNEVAKLVGHLRSMGGEGVTEDGLAVYRQVIANVVPLGIGLTESPAAEVQGVAVEENAVALEIKEEKMEKDSNSSTEDNTIVEENEKIDISEENILENQETISHCSENTVIENKDSTIMEINNISDITDEALKEVQASAITDFIKSELEKASEEFTSKQVEAEEALKAAQDEKETLTSEHSQLKEEMTKVQEQLDTLEAEKLEREKLETFNQRMAELDEEYDLSDEARQAIAEEIKDLDEESWATKKTHYTALLNKKAEVEVETAEAEVQEEIKASEEVEPENKTEETAEAEEQEVVDEAVDSAEEQTDSVPVTSEAAEPTVYEKYKDAFGDEGFEVKF